MAGSRVGVDVYEGRVLPEWIDANQHMNVAYYVLAFDLAVDSVWSRIGITDDYLQDEQNSTFAVETHVTYQQELRLDERFIVTTQILAYDAKRIHQFMRMYRAQDGRLSATTEWMNLHVDMTVRRVSPWPDSVLRRIRKFVALQGSVSLPDEVGRKIAVKTPHWQAEGY